MAWVSVDQKVLGGKLRKTFKDIGCSRSEALGILVTLWLWAIDNTDQDGLIIGADRADIAEQIRIGVNGLDPEMVVDNLIKNGWIDEPETGRLYIHDWFEWRSFYNKYIDGKKKHSERQQQYMTRKKKLSVVNDDVSDDVSTDVTPEEPKKKSAYSSTFEDFWKVYPRKDDKGMAYKKYNARLNDGYSPDQLLSAARRYAEQIRRDRTEKKFTKQAKTFLSETLPFTDYLPSMQEPQKTQTDSVAVNPFRRGGSS